MNALTVLIAWFSMVIFLLLAFIGWLIYEDLPAVYIEFAISSFFINIMLHVLLAFFVRCPSCGKCLTIQGFGEPHVKSKKFGDIEGWAAVVLHWFSGKVTCIYCGEEVNTNAL